MGSNGAADDQAHPPSSSPLITLTHPTPAELPKISALSHPNWGGALTLQDYLDREDYMTTVPLSKNGGITHWLLTLASSPESDRPILASCESIKKRAFYTTPSGEVREGIAHGVASVFTDPQYRGKGYASRMMSDVGEKVRTWQLGGEDRPVVFSVLYSDIGKGFYSKHGWAPFQSSHVAWTPAEFSGERAAGVKTIGYHELAELCAVDERLLKERLAKMAKADGGKKRHVALAPELDQLLWHLMREDFMTKHIFGKTPEVRGAVYGEKGRRVWAVWTRGFYGGLRTTEGNTLHVLRVVVEDEDDTPEEELVEGFKAIVEIARAEAKEWNSEDIQMWNPTKVVKKLVEKIGVEYEFVERDKKSIASLRWYGEEAADEIDWVANEKYAWC
ncbi:hypothetical protein QBC40DRAFT_279043 [Triangularia verruculosa]|uniref:LYC1 C-terminal domain-containing protein n=1 Tax=Triangularia verruculosa TaxID=2587418 RepID=A0AAN7AVN8_9PEZI|nr:hypothetical protein QBC40DRAFT_279043 [Triangularia verruculosa]